VGLVARCSRGRWVGVSLGLGLAVALACTATALAAVPALSPVTGSPFTVGTGPRWVAFSPGGSLLAVANTGEDSVSLFSVGSDGSLTAVAGSPFATGTGPELGRV
jgi:DNA-binding beta-propeller fold protein YncE